jgi:hypothetical protein
MTLELPVSSSGFSENAKAFSENLYREPFFIKTSLVAESGTLTISLDFARDDSSM